MLDLNYIPGVGQIGQCTQDVFIGTYKIGSQTPDVWFKPRGKTMCHIVCIGGGGGGGAGFSGTAGTNAGGGGGGGSGAQCIVTMPLYLLPDVLYVHAGGGGPGGPSSGNGGTGGQYSVIKVNPSTSLGSTDDYIVLANQGGGGASGAATGAASGGSAGTVTAISRTLFLLGGLVATNISLAGQAGAAGGTATANSPGSSITLPTTGLVVSGGGGGGANGAGGSITGAGAIPTITGTNTPGNAGHRWPNLANRLFFNTGGSGAGSDGGRGGDGGYGSGGGGGSAGTVGGAGGNGGPGIIVITCW